MGEKIEKSAHLQLYIPDYTPHDLDLIKVPNQINVLLVIGNKINNLPEILVFQKINQFTGADYHPLQEIYREQV